MIIILIDLGFLFFSFYTLVPLPEKHNEGQVLYTFVKGLKYLFLGSSLASLYYQLTGILHAH